MLIQTIIVAALVFASLLFLARGLWVRLAGFHKACQAEAKSCGGCAGCGAAKTQGAAKTVVFYPYKR